GGGRGECRGEMHDEREQRGGGGTDLLGEVGQRRALRQLDDLAVAARGVDAADRGRLHVVELLTPLLLGLAAPSRPATGPPEGTRRTATATAAATGTRAETAATTATTAARTRSAATARATGTAPRTGTTEATTGAGTAR